jgi:apolipoprotein N-acyltransferase
MMNSSIVHRLKRPLAAFFVGAVTPLAFAPYSYWPIAFASVLVLLLIQHKQTAKQGLASGFCYGLGLFGFGISWVHVSIDTFGGMPKLASLFLMLLLVSYLSLFPALFGYVNRRYSPKLNNAHSFAFLIAAWLSIDWLRGWMLTGFPWLLLGYSQIDSPYASFAPIGGVDLVTLSVVASSLGLYFAVTNKRWQWAIPTVAIGLLSVTAGKTDWVTPDHDQVTSVALVQGNIAQEKKWLPAERWPTLLKFMDLTRENWDADIIVWPEAAIPAFEREVRSFLTSLDEAAKLNNSAVITGVVTAEQGDYYNSVITLGKTNHDAYDYATQQRYHKYHLLPFGEFVPLESLLRPLAPFFNLPMSSFARGERIQPNLVAGDHHLVTALCYEIIFNQLVRDNITQDSDYILTLSNDAWFGTSAGPWQHMEIARMRALELGKPVIRATNNGVTMVTDHKGDIVAEIPQFTTSVLRAEITPTRGTTPFLSFGVLPLKLLVVLLLAISVIRLRPIKS